MQTQSLPLIEWKNRLIQSDLESKMLEPCRDKGCLRQVNWMHLRCHSGWLWSSCKIPFGFLQRLMKLRRRLPCVGHVVVQLLSRVRLCDPMDCSTPGFPVPHDLLEFAQIHVYWVNDVIQPSHPLSLPLLLPSVFPSIRVFSNELALHIRCPKYWSFSFSISPSSEYSGLISFRIDWFDLLAVHLTLKSLLQ